MEEASPTAHLILRSLVRNSGWSAVLRALAAQALHHEDEERGKGWKDVGNAIGDAEAMLVRNGLERKEW